MVLLEDTGALVGLLFALLGVGLTMLTGDPVWDGVGTIAHRRAARRHRGRPDGRDAQPADRRGRHHATRTAAIRAALEQTDNIDRLIHLRTQYLGPEEMLVGAKIALAPSTDLATVAATIDAAEAAIRAAVPAAAGHLPGTRSRSGADRLAARFSAQEQPHVVPNGPADELHRRHHVEAVQQAEPAQKPFGENGIRLGRAEELVEQPARPGGTTTASAPRPGAGPGLRSRSSSTPGTSTSRSRR